MSEKFDYPSWLGPITIILLIIHYLLFFPIALRFIKSTWTLRFEMYMQARKIRATLICAIALLTIIIIHPILLYLYFWSNLNNDIVDTIIHILVIVLSIVPLVCVALRLWLFYYTHKYTEAIFKERRIGLQMEKTEELKAITPAGNRQSVSPFVRTPKTVNSYPSYPDIDPGKLQRTDTQVSNVGSRSNRAFTSSRSSSEDLEIIKMASTLSNPLQFWIDHRHKLGSLRACLRIVAIFVIIDICIISICVFVHAVSIGYCIQSAIYIVLLIWIHFHVHRLPAFRDEFFVRKQFVAELKILYLNLLLWITCVCIWYFTMNKDETYNIYDNSDNIYIRIIIRLLLDGNMICTAFLLIIFEFVVPFISFSEGIDTLSNRNVLIGSKENKQLKIPLFQCMTHNDGYYLFMEHLMKEFCVENLLFITEVGYMKQKFENAMIVSRSPAYSSSVGRTIKTALSQISERVASQRESSVSKSSDAYRVRKEVLSPSMTAAKEKEISLPIITLSSIPSGNEFNVAKLQIDIKQDTNQQNNATTTDNSMFEMGVINGKRLTLTGNIIGDKRKTSTESIIGDKRQMDLPRLPHTVTLAESMKQNNLFDSVDMIYDNFVQINAQYQINISAAVRQNISKIVMQHRSSLEAQREKLQAKGIDQGVAIPTLVSGIIVDVHIFDDASTEILALLRSSYYRFARTKQYKIFCNALQNKS